MRRPPETTKPLAMSRGASVLDPPLCQGPQLHDREAFAQGCEVGFQVSVTVHKQPQGPWSQTVSILVR